MMKKKISCRTFSRHLPESLYGEASSSVHLALREHARLCPGCARILQDMEDTVTVLRRHPLPEFTTAELSELRRGLRERIKTLVEKPRREERSWSHFSYRLIPAAAMVVILTVVAWMAFRPGRERWELQPEIMAVVSMSETIELEFQAMGELWEEMDNLEMLLGVRSNNGSEASLTGIRHMA